VYKIAAHPPPLVNRRIAVARGRELGERLASYIAPDHAATVRTSILYAAAIMG
jgi:hypothetical protein